MHGFPHLNETSSLVVLWAVWDSYFSNDFGDNILFARKIHSQYWEGRCGKAQLGFPPCYGSSALTWGTWGAGFCGSRSRPSTVTSRKIRAFPHWDTQTKHTLKKHLSLHELNHPALHGKSVCQSVLWRQVESQRGEQVLSISQKWRGRGDKELGNSMSTPRNLGQLLNVRMAPGRRGWSYERWAFFEEFIRMLLTYTFGNRHLPVRILQSVGAKQIHFSILSLCLLS